MPMNESQRDDLSKFAGKIRLDAICDRFESLWMSGQRPSMEDLLPEASEEERSELFEQLLSLELEYRLRKQEQPTAEEYLAAYPSYKRQIEKVYSELQGRDVKGASASEPLHQPVHQDFPADLGPGTRLRYLGDYELLEELGRGGMGVVYKARQVSLNRVVAVKMILGGVLANPAAIRRFHAEAEAAAGLDHPGIVPVFEVGQHGGQHYFSMSYINGQSLSQRIAESPLLPREAARIMVQVAEAVEYAHGQKVIHRDLKPGNILLDRSGQPRVTDFGLAKRLDQDSSLTVSGTLVGTPSYMPPEQATGQGKRVDARSDVYSLGATLYAMLSGRPPFQADNWSDTCLQVVHQEPIPLRRLNPKLPRDLETICRKCLEKAPGRRYASVQEFAAELGRYLRGVPIHARHISRPERLWRWCRRNPSGMAVFIMLLAGVLSTSLAILASNGSFAIHRSTADGNATTIKTEDPPPAVAYSSREVDPRNWAKRMFAQTDHDFGVIGPNVVAAVCFRLQNIYTEDVEIGSVTASDAFVQAKASKCLVKTWDKAGINVVVKAPSAEGRRRAVVTVEFSKPFPAKLQLELKMEVRRVAGLSTPGERRETQEARHESPGSSAVWGRHSSLGLTCARIEGAYQHDEDHGLQEYRMRIMSSSLDATLKVWDASDCLTICPHGTPLKVP
jgi:serine/threonine protein kinase